VKAKNRQQNNKLAQRISAPAKTAIFPFHAAANNNFVLSLCFQMGNFDAFRAEIRHAPLRNTTGAQQSSNPVELAFR
jgi:hypothetical protein